MDTFLSSVVMVTPLYRYNLLTHTIHLQNVCVNKIVFCILKHSYLKCSPCFSFLNKKK